jgi:hypothetical protein
MTIVHLAWDASADPTVTGYMVHAGQRSGVYSITQDVGNVLDAAIDLPTLGRWFTAIGAYNAALQEALGAELAMYVAPANVVISPYVPNIFRARHGSSPTPPERTVFFSTEEFFGAQAYTDPAITRNVSRGLLNMLSLQKPCDAGMLTKLQSVNVGFEFSQPGSTIHGDSAATINTEATNAANIANTIGQSRCWWLTMAEWDQSGGAWVGGGNRPTYGGQTRQQAYATFTNYYLGLTPLGTKLAQPIGSRPIRLAAVSDYGQNAFIAFQIGGQGGVDVGMLERAIDELGDTSTGLMYIRGAGRLYGRLWGIDLSTWRTSANSATSYNDAGTQTGGWSASYLRRHLYIAFLGGAHVVRVEPTIYEFSNTTLNPFGQMIDAYTDFALTRHPDVGSPVTPLALLFDFYSGFDTKHGPFNQYDGVWYGDIAYSSGDFMINNFFKVAVPSHQLHGQTPGAPFGNPANTAQYLSFLAAGGDPRPYEPMPTTRWGDTMDITLTTATASALSRYRIVALMGGVVIDASLRAALQTFAEAGGTVVVNTEQATAADQTLLGVTLGGAAVSGGTSTWTATNESFTEAAYTYRPVTLTTATVLATTSGAAPLITQNLVGSGRVILTTPLFMQNTARSALTAIGVKLFDELMKGVLPVTVTGPPVEFMVNAGPGRLITTLVNSVAAGTTWTGTIAAPIAGSVTAVREWIGDTNAAFTNVGGVVTITASVPAFDVKVYAIDYV